MSDSVSLTKREARSLAWRILIRHMQDTESWLHWEDLPMLDEESFRLVGESIRGDMVQTTRHVNAMYDKQWGIDAALLEERARG